MRGVVGGQTLKISPAWKIGYAQSVVDKVQSVGLDRVRVLQRREDLDVTDAIGTAARGQGLDALDEA